MLEDVAVVEVHPGMTREWHLHANGLAGKHQHGVVPPGVGDAGTQRVRRASAGPSDDTELTTVYVDGMRGLHAHRIGEILQIPELRRARGDGFPGSDVPHLECAAI